MLLLWGSTRNKRGTRGTHTRAVLLLLLLLISRAAVRTYRFVFAITAIQNNWGIY